MVNRFSRKVMSTALVSSLLLSAGGAVVYAAPKDDKKDTGRTELNVQTGVISSKYVIAPRGAQEVILSGTVEIDGPQLVVKIPGVENTKVTKVGDKVWMFEALVDISAFEDGDNTLNISAHTIYTNGKNAGAVHTSAPTFKQEIHVPFITSTVAENTKWTAYNRSSNEFTLSYDEVENWSKGDPVVTPKWLTAGGKDADVAVLGTTEKVPTAIQHITFSENATWGEFDTNSKTYSATFDVHITDSKGVVTTKQVTETGLVPGIENLISYSVSDEFGTLTESKSYTAPVAPVVNLVPEELENLVLTLINHNDNQYKLSASYKVIYTNKTTAEKTSELDGNIKKPNKGSETKDFKIEGFVYTVTVTYNPVTGKDEAKAVLKK